MTETLGESSRQMVMKIFKDQYNYSLLEMNHIMVADTELGKNLGAQSSRPNGRHFLREPGELVPYV